MSVISHKTRQLSVTYFRVLYSYIFRYFDTFRDHLVTVTNA